jgi:hypothetical protein
MVRFKGYFPISSLMLALLLSGASAQAAQKGFPEEGEVEYEHSIITIPITLEGETQPAEVLKLDAFMRLIRERPVRNGLGYRQFEFTIDAWELYGYSKVLNANITFKLADTVKPKSLGVSLQKNKDYPAMIVYNAIYDVYLNDVKIINQQPGVAFATGVMEIPPRNITVAFQKPFSLKEARRKDPKLSSALDKEGISIGPPPFFDPGTCEDMTQITGKQFEAGVAEAARYRTQFSRPNQAKGKGTAGSPALARAKSEKKPSPR